MIWGYHHFRKPPNGSKLLKNLGDLSLRMLLLLQGCLFPIFFLVKQLAVSAEKTRRSFANPFSNEDSLFSWLAARWDPYCNEIWQADLELLYCIFELFFCSFWPWTSEKYLWFSFESKHIKQQPLQESSLILDTDIMLSLMTWAPGSWWHLLKQGYGSLHPLMTPFIVSRYTT